MATAYMSANRSENAFSTADLVPEWAQEEVSTGVRKCNIAPFTLYRFECVAQTEQRGIYIHATSAN